MIAEFKVKKVEGHDVEFVVLSGGYLGKDTAERPATPDDRLVYAVEYEAFKNPPSPAAVTPPAVKDAAEKGE